MAERILKRLTPNGLDEVTWSVSDPTFRAPEFTEAGINYWTNRRREKMANFLAKQINKLACQHCPLATDKHNVFCTKAGVDRSFQVGADLFSQNPLTRKE